MMNPLQLISSIFSGGNKLGFSQMIQLANMMKSGQIDPNQFVKMFENNPTMQQAQKMLNSGGDPKQIVRNVAKQQGIDIDEICKLFNVKL